MVLCLGLGSGVRGQPFYCTGELILASSPNGDSSFFYSVETDPTGSGSVIFTEISDSPDIYLNAIGYSTRDHYVYGIAPGSRELCRLSASGNVEVLGELEELNTSRSYNSGAITPDGQYLIALSARAGTPPFNNLEVVRVRLQGPDYAVETFPISTLSGNVISTRDISFHPITGALYGYDGIEGRLVTISLTSFQVDDLTYARSGDVETMAALFFDAWGNLYGYGRESGQVGINSFYRLDTESGAVELIGSGPAASGSDGCSCPYRIELVKSVEPPITTPCSEVIYKFIVINSSGSTQNSVRFEDQLPDGFQVLALLSNPYDADVTGLNSGKLTLSDMTIPVGIDSFEVLVQVGDVVPGGYKNQAVLSGLPITLGGRDLSDDPRTFALNDSTELEVIPFSFSEQLDSLVFICPDESIRLDASFLPGNYGIIWSTGETGPFIDVASPGIYDVVATNDCRTIQVIFEVQLSSEDFALELGPDTTISLGDFIEIKPDLVNAESPLLSWSLSSDEILDCADCPVQLLYPTNTTTYYLTATDVNGCIFIDSLKVTVEKDYTAFVPNVFSPNGDGINDMLNIYSDNGAMVEVFTVFDRWGNTVFESSGHRAGDLTVGWDGTWRDRFVQPGVYVWIALLEYPDGVVKEYSGDVTVVR